MIGIINITGIQVAQRADDYFQPVNDFHEHSHQLTDRARHVFYVLCSL